MDIYSMYLGDSYSSLRNPMHRDYEKHPYGTWENSPASKTCYQAKNYQGHYQQKSNGKEAKEKCPFCKEQKKRPLIAYIRKRDNKKHSESICEEEEEEQQQQTAKKETKSK